MADWRFKILYDGACPVCRREMNWLKRRDRHSRLAFEDISSPESNASRYGCTKEELMEVIHGLTPEGQIVRRMEVFRRAYSAVGLGWLTAPTGWPGLRWLFDRLYDLFAKNRMRIGGFFGRGCHSGHCELKTGK